ncbi:MAG: DUF455 family protein [Planctomycetota bacterium]|nr:DUF455 family protein [Planctomycetota bacterium]
MHVTTSLQGPGTVERWCEAFVLATTLEGKLAPPPPPDLRADSSWEPVPAPLRIAAPARPPELSVVARAPGAPRPEAVCDPAARARLLHTFVHHELQAAELFAWGVLAFPATPREFRAGLVRLALEELEHLQLYLALLEGLGRRYGDFPVRDWFWQRVPSCTTPESFVALQGLGLEGANLEHAARYAAAFRQIGDARSAAVLEQVEREEITHVAFARHWFERFTGAPLDYERWKAALPPPLSPAILRGKPLNLAARRRAGLDEQFLARLEAEPLAREAQP